MNFIYWLIRGILAIPFYRHNQFIPDQIRKQFPSLVCKYFCYVIETIITKTGRINTHNSGGVIKLFWSVDAPCSIFDHLHADELIVASSTKITKHFASE